MSFLYEVQNLILFYFSNFQNYTLPDLFLYKIKELNFIIFIYQTFSCDL